MFMVQDFSRQTTHDHLLNGTVILEQPTDGYRVALDPVFLAAFVPVKPHQQILDVGCGVGAAALCLARRLSQVHITGLEIQPFYAHLARCNNEHNNFTDRLTIIEGDLQDRYITTVTPLRCDAFHHVMTNPPYFLDRRATPSPYEHKALATVERHISLQQWVDFCLKMLKDQGTLSIIFPTDRLDELLSCLTHRTGDITLYPLWPNRYKPAKRILIRAKKNSRSPTQVLTGCILHDDDGQYTNQAQQVLRWGRAIVA